MGEYTLTDNETIFDVLHKFGLRLKDVRVKKPEGRIDNSPEGIWWVGRGDTVQWGKSGSQTGKSLECRVNKPMPVIDVYLGFMDEEVNARLAKLIDGEKNKGGEARPVILVERGRIEPDEPILEWHLGNYPVDGKRVRKIFHVSPQGKVSPTEGAKAPVPAAPPEAPEIPSPPALPEDYQSHGWGKAYTLWKNKRDGIIAVTPVGKIILESSLEIYEDSDQGKIKKVGTHPEIPFATVYIPGSWKRAYYDWKSQSIKTAENWGQALSDWKKKSAKHDKEQKQPKKQEQAEGAKVSGESTAPEDILAQAMEVYMAWDIAADLDWLARGLKVKRYFDVMQLLQHRGHPKTKSKLPEDATGQGPWLSVIRFNVGDDKNPPIIVIRTPEMGLQPSLMCPYLAFLFKVVAAMSSALAAEDAKRNKRVVVGSDDERAGLEHGSAWEFVPTKDKQGEDIYVRRLKNWMEWEWPLRVSQFGAQGSSSLAYTPGSTVSIVASLLVGVEIASDITVHAQDEKHDKRPLKATFDHSEDGTAAAPHSVAPKQQKEAEEKGQISQDYRDYKEIRAGETALNAYAVISLCTPAGVYDFLRRRIDTYEDIKGLMNTYAVRGALEGEEITERHREWQAAEGGFNTPAEKMSAAQDIAADIFRSQVRGDRQNLLTLKRRIIDKGGPFSRFEQNIEPNDTLRDVISKIKQAYKDRFFYKEAEREGVVTLSVSYFGGDEDKVAADKLGIMGVNMEDYHVLRVLRSAVAQGTSDESDYPIILGWRIDRINCDPKKLPPDIEKNFNAFAKTPEAMLTVDDYARVIIWGLRGLLREDIGDKSVYGAVRDTVRWKFLDSRRYFPKMKDLKPFFWSFVTHGQDRISDRDRSKFWVPDPFCIEIATDFVNELANIKATEDERRGKDGKLGPAGGIAGIENKEVSKLKKLRELAKGVQEAWKVEQRKGLGYLCSQSKTKAAAMKLMECCKTDFGFDAGNNKLKMWLRPCKWAKDITEPTLQDAAGKNQFKAAAIDRAFYKSSNMMALQTMADYFLWEGGTEGTEIPARGRMD